MRARTAIRCLWSVRANAINATLYDKLNFNFIRDIAPVAGIIRVPKVMVVNPIVSGKTVSEFIAYAKANPGKINVASSGIGTRTHMAGELFKMMTGVEHGPCALSGRGAALAPTCSADRCRSCSMRCLSRSSTSRTGKLRALAVTTATRSEVLPDIPTVGEFVPGYEASIPGTASGAPKHTPAEIIEQLNREINAALADPKIKARLADQGGTVLPGSPADFGKLIADETEKWAKVIRAANVKPE